MIKQNKKKSLGDGRASNNGNNRTAGLEQYYTPEDVSTTLTKTFLEICGKSPDTIYLEPCGGTGSFIDALISNDISKEKIISYDIEPKHDLVKKADFLKLPLSKIPQGVHCITNPPFGRNHSLSVPFFNKSAERANYIGFIIPKSWRKWSIQNRLNPSFHLIYDEEVVSHYVDEDGEQIYSTDKPGINTVFQIWERRDYFREKVVVENRGYIEKVQPKDADCSIVIFGRSCGEVTFEDIDKKAKTTTIYLKIHNDKVTDLLPQLDYGKFCNNVAFVEALAWNEILFLLNEEMDKIESK